MLVLAFHIYHLFLLLLLPRLRARFACLLHPRWKLQMSALKSCLLFLLLSRLPQTRLSCLCLLAQSFLGVDPVYPTVGMTCTHGSHYNYSLGPWLRLQNQFPLMSAVETMHAWISPWVPSSVLKNIQLNLSIKLLQRVSLTEIVCAFPYSITVCMQTLGNSSLARISTGLIYWSPFVMGGTLDCHLTLTPKIQSTITQVLQTLSLMCNPILIRNWPVVLWLDRSFQKIYLLKLLLLPLVLCPRQIQKPGELSLTALSLVLGSMSGYLVKSTEESLGISTFLGLIILCLWLVVAGIGIQGIRWSCISSTSLGIIEIGESVLAMCPFSLSGGLGKSFWICPIPSGTGQQCLVPSDPLKASPGWSGPSSPLHRDLGILALIVVAALSAVVATMRSLLTWMILLVCVHREFQSLCGLPFCNFWITLDLSLLRQLATCVRPPEKSSVWGFLLIWTIIPCLFLKVNWKKLSSFSKTGCQGLLQQNGNYRSCLEYFSTFRGSSGQAAYLLTACLIPLEPQRHWTLPFPSELNSTRMCPGGSGTSAAGMGFPCFNSHSSTTRLPWTHPATLIGTAVQELVGSTSFAMSISELQCLMECLIGELKTWSCLHISLQPVFGDGAGLGSKFMVKLTHKIQSFFSETGEDGSHIVWTWPAYFVRCKRALASCGSLMAFAQNRTFLLTVYHAGLSLNAELHFIRHSSLRVVPMQSVSQFCHTTSTSLLCDSLGLLRDQLTPAISLSLLQETLNKLRAMAWASSTVKSLNSRQKAYVQFCENYNIVPIPASPEDLSLFATWLVASERIKSADSIRQYLSAVRTMHRANGSDCVTPKSNHLLDTAVRGIARMLAKPPKRMAPITPGILHHITSFPSVFPESSPWAARATITIIKQLYKVLFFSMARISSFVPDCQGNFDGRRQLTWDRVELYPDGAVLKLPLTKTIQTAGRVQEISLARAQDSDYCPVAALSLVASIRGECRAGDPVFAMPSKNGWSPLSRYNVDLVLTAQLKNAGIDSSMYSFHSFRRGGIQFAMRLEPRLHLIRLQSDHSSKAFEAYTALPAETRFDLTQKMASELAIYLV